MATRVAAGEIASSGPAGAQRIAVWQAGAPLPHGVGGAELIPHGTGALLAGGETWLDDATAPGGRVKRRLDAILRWDAADGAWHEAGRLPRAGSNFVLGRSGDALVAMGGFDGETLGRELWRRTDSAAWSSVGTWSAPAWGNAGAQLGAALYSFGGWSDAEAKQIGAALWRWDVAADDAATTQQAVRCASLPGAGRALSAIAACGGALYVFGGLAQQGEAVFELNEAWRYVPARDRWEPLQPLPVFAHAQRATALDEHTVLIAGGYGGSAAAEDAQHKLAILPDVYLYDTRTDRYTRLADLPAPICDMPVLRIGTQLLAAGGEDRARSRAAQTWLAEINEAEQP